MSNPEEAPLHAAGPGEEREEGAEGRLLRLAVSCPRCGARPALRVTDSAVRAIAAHLPEARVGTYQCQRRQCGAIYDLGVAAFRNAS